MKLLALLAMLPCTTVAFQHSAHVHYKITHQTELDRAEECAISYDVCDVEELEGLADELQQFQSSASSEEKRVYDILQKQKELKRLMEDLANGVRPEDEERHVPYHDDYLHHHW